MKVIFKAVIFQVKVKMELKKMKILFKVQKILLDIYQIIIILIIKKYLIVK